MDRLIEFFNQLVRKACAGLPYAGQYDYSVTSCDVTAQTLSARSLDANLPDLTDVPMVSPGLILDVPPGTTVKVGFAGLNPSAPYIASYGSGGSSRVKNSVHMGWLVAAQATGPAFAVTLTYVPWGPLPPVGPTLVPPNTPTLLSAAPVAFVLEGGQVLGSVP